MIVDEVGSSSSKIDDNIDLLVNPGTTYLKIMQYYAEEKLINEKNLPNKLENWEKFISKYFAENVDMSVKVFDKDDLFYEINTTYDNMVYIYLHKNKSLFNKWIFIDNYYEFIEKDDENLPVKGINIKDCLNVLEYKKHKIFIHLDAICKFNAELKYQYVNIKINNIEIYDETNSKNLNIFELKSHLFSLYYNFKSFMEVNLKYK